MKFEYSKEKYMYKRLYAMVCSINSCICIFHCNTIYSKYY